MGFRKSDTVYEWQLTDAELDIVRQLSDPDVKRIVKREGAGLGVHTAAYLKLVARLRAERLVYQELQALRAAREQVASLVEAEVTIATQRSQIHQLEKQLEIERSEHTKELAAPAMVVHSEPTGR